jgi:hypothetical protein
MINVDEARLSSKTGSHLSLSSPQTLSSSLLPQSVSSPDLDPCPSRALGSWLSLAPQAGGEARGGGERGSPAVRHQELRRGRGSARERSSTAHPRAELEELACPAAKLAVAAELGSPGRRRGPRCSSAAGAAMASEACASARVCVAGVTAAARASTVELMPWTSVVSSQWRNHRFFLPRCKSRHDFLHKKRCLQFSLSFFVDKCATLNFSGVNEDRNQLLNAVGTALMPEWHRRRASLGSRAIYVHVQAAVHSVPPINPSVRPSISRLARPGRRPVGVRKWCNRASATTRW